MTPAAVAPAPRGKSARRALTRRAALLLALIGVLMPAAAARADFLPSRPITFWNDRIVISGDATLTIGQVDRGYFNSLDYYHDALNLVRFGLSLEFKANERISVLGQVIDQTALRSDSNDSDAWSSDTTAPPWDPFETNRHIVRPYALFVRVRPLLDKPITVQAGRIPPVFGAYANQDYGAAQPLISLPLAYHYPTTLRADSVVRSSVGLARWRGGGWRVRYRTGADTWGQGVPLVSAQRWDTGVQVKVGDAGPIEVSGALTNGTLSSPQFEDDNGGKQISGRVALRPATGLVLGVSGAQGDFLSDDLIATLPAEAADRSYRQRALGVDAEYSRGYWLVKSETIFTSWRMPALDAPLLDEPLRAWSTFVEGRYRLTPRIYVAARGEHLGFSKIQAGAEYNNQRVTWDAAVTRAEIGVGYSIQRNVRLKLAYQYDWRDVDWRDGGPTPRRGAVATQIGYWF
jgi:hypothetical protein